MMAVNGWLIFSPFYLDRYLAHFAIQVSSTKSKHSRTVLQLSICSHRTTLDDIEAVFNKLSSIGAELDQAELEKREAAVKHK